MEKKIIKSEKPTDRIQTIINDSVIAGMCVSISVISGFSCLKSIRYEEELYRIIIYGGVSAFTAVLAIIFRCHVVNEKDKFNKALIKKKKTINN